MSDKSYQSPLESERIPAKDLRERIADNVIAEAKQRAQP